MTTIRSALFMVAFVLITCLFSLVIISVGRFASLRLMAKLGSGWAHSSLWCLRLLCGLRYRVQGAEHLPDYPVVVLCKHQSAWETVALRLILPPEQAWVLKRELLKIPLFGWALAQYQPIAIDRGSARQALKQLLQQGQALIAQGRWLVVFPEGTRVASGEEKRFNIGGAKLAELAQVPIVPIAHNAGAFWPRRSLLKRPGVIDVVIGPPIAPQSRTATELNALAEQWINDTVRTLPA